MSEPAQGAASDGPWFAGGLRFTCTRCGNCCTGAPGFTWVGEEEIAALAARFGMDDAAFRRRYTRKVWRDGVQQVSLTDKSNHDCVFYRRGEGCTVYEERPKQCRTWPFWRRVVASRESWDDEARGCPGMDHGQRYDAAAIAARAADDGLPR